MYTKALFTAFCCAMLLSPAVSFGANEAAKAKPASKETVAVTQATIETAINLLIII